MHVGGFHAVPGRCRGLQGLQGPSGASLTTKNPAKTPCLTKNALAAYRQSLEPWARLKFHAGWSGWTRPPTIEGEGGGGGGARLEACARRSRGGF